MHASSRPKRRDAAAASVVMLVAMSLGACGGRPEAALTTPLPLQSSGLVVGGDVLDHSTEVHQYGISPEELDAIRAACQDAQGIPLGNGDACLQTIENSSFQLCTHLVVCVEVFAVNGTDFNGAGYVQIVDPRPTGSLCDSAAGATCLRVSIDDQALAALAGTQSSETSSGATSGDTGSGTTGTTSEPPPSSSPTGTSPGGSPSTQPLATATP